MYVNKCTKCGAEFETKNPKRVICPGCLYPDRQGISLKSYKDSSTTDEAKARPQTETDGNFRQKSPGFYVGGSSQDRPPRDDNYRPRQNDGYNRRPPQGDGFRRPQQRDDGYRPRQNDGYRRPQQRNDNYRPRQNDGYNRRPPQSGGFRRPQQSGGFRRPQQGGFRGGPNRRPNPAKKLLISKEQVAQIEEMYTKMLPLPNPDCHEVIGEKINLEPNKVFFGINLVRQKMNLPKLPYPKRKLAVSPDQLIAIKNLYEPLLPLPPIGCHKFIAKMIKMDEWRVHVGIGILRKQMGLERWNPDRDDAPEEFKNQTKESSEAKE